MNKKIKLIEEQINNMEEKQMEFVHLIAGIVFGIVASLGASIIHDYVIKQSALLYTLYFISVFVLLFWIVIFIYRIIKRFDKEVKKRENELAKIYKSK